MTTPDAEFAASELRRYAALVWEPADLVELRPIPEMDKRVWTSAGRADKQVDRMMALNARSIGIYAGVLPRTNHGGGTGKHTNGGRVLWADFDNLAPDAALERVRASGLPPPMLVVSSGHGAHVYWKLDRKLDSQAHTDMRDALKRFCMDHPGLSEHFDPVSMDAARVLRVPGFINHKHPDAPVLCRITYTDEAAVAATEAWEAVLPRPVEKAAAPRPQTVTANLPDVERRAIAYLSKLPPAISGQRGHNTTYNAARVLAHDFGLPKDRALAILLDHYNPRCEPPWTERELRHKVENAANKPHDRPFGYLRDAVWEPDADGPPADISGILAQASAPGGIVTPPARPGLQPMVEVEAEMEADDSPEDPGPMPEDLARIPGFISDVMDFTLECMPGRNPITAFCGALSLQAHLAGRKVRGPENERTNFYLLALADAGAGKDPPRKTNNRIMNALGLSKQIGQKFASGEAIQDALARTPAKLYQTDEIDGLLQSINKSKDARMESIMDELRTVYTSADNTYTLRDKANVRRGEEPPVIDQPCLNILGTAPPDDFYAALSDRMLTNGFFARMLVVEADLPVSDKAGRIIEIPDHVLEAARWWAEFYPPAPGGARRNLYDEHPEPLIVRRTPEAEGIIAAWRTETIGIRNEAKARRDRMTRTAWSRTFENTIKLALIYAISVNRFSPVIDREAAEWAIRFMRHQTLRMLFMVRTHVCENDVHARKQRILRLLQNARGGVMDKSAITRRTQSMRPKERDETLEDLAAAGDIEIGWAASATRARAVIRLRRFGEARKDEDE